MMAMAIKIKSIRITGLSTDACRNFPSVRTEGSSKMDIATIAIGIMYSLRLTLSAFLLDVSLNNQIPNKEKVRATAFKKVLCPDVAKSVITPVARIRVPKIR